MSESIDEKRSEALALALAGLSGIARQAAGTAASHWAEQVIRDVLAIAGEENVTPRSQLIEHINELQIRCNSQEAKLKRMANRYHDMQAKLVLQKYKAAGAAEESS